MIPAAFEYHRPSDLPAALALLQQHGDEARVIAGGHSLIPMMKLRMAEGRRGALPPEPPGVFKEQ